MFKICQVPSAPSPIPPDSDSDLSDLIDLDQEPEQLPTAMDNIVHPCPAPRYDKQMSRTTLKTLFYSLCNDWLFFHRYPRKEIPMELSNHVPSPVLPPVNPLAFTPKHPSIDTFDAMMFDAMSKTASKPTAAQTPLQQTDFAHYISQRHEPTMRPRSDALSISVSNKRPWTQDPSSSQRSLEQPMMNNAASVIAPHQPPLIQQPNPSQGCLNKTVMNIAIPALAPHLSALIQPNPNQWSLEQPIMNNMLPATVPHQLPLIQQSNINQRSQEQAVLNVIPPAAPHQPPVIQQSSPNKRSLEQAVMNNVDPAAAPHQPSPTQLPSLKQGSLDKTVLNIATPALALQQSALIQSNPNQWSQHQPETEQAAVTKGHIQPPEINSLCLTVEDPYFGLDSPQSIKTLSVSFEDIPAIKNWTENQCFTGPVLKLNDKPLTAPSLEDKTGQNTDILQPSSVCIVLKLFLICLLQRRCRLSREIEPSLKSTNRKV